MHIKWRLCSSDCITHRNYFLNISEWPNSFLELTWDWGNPHFTLGQHKWWILLCHVRLVTLKLRLLLQLPSLGQYGQVNKKSIQHWHVCICESETADWVEPNLSRGRTSSERPEERTKYDAYDENKASEWGFTRVGTHCIWTGRHITVGNYQ